MIARVAVLLSLVFACLPLSAQSRVSGRLVDARDGSSVPDAAVVLLSNSGRVQRIQQTDSMGVFAFEEVTPGRFRLRASRVGYNTAHSSYLDLALTDTLVVEIHLSGTEVLLEPVRVVARSIPRSSPMLSGFYRRMDAGMGRYITRDDVERRGAMYVSDLLVTLPGVRLGAWSPSGRQIFMSRSIKTGGGGCPVQFFVDNVHVNRTRGLNLTGTGTRDTAAASGGGVAVIQQASIDEYVDPAAIEGIEVYSGIGSVPAEFMTQDARCGTVVVWTRRGYQD